MVSWSNTNHRKLENGLTKGSVQKVEYVGASWLEVHLLSHRFTSWEDDHAFLASWTNCIFLLFQPLKNWRIAFSGGWIDDKAIESLLMAWREVGTQVLAKYIQHKLISPGPPTTYLDWFVPAVEFSKFSNRLLICVCNPMHCGLWLNFPSSMMKLISQTCPRTLRESPVKSKDVQLSKHFGTLPARHKQHQTHTCVKKPSRKRILWIRMNNHKELSTYLFL